MQSVCQKNTMQLHSTNNFLLKYFYELLLTVNKFFVCRDHIILWAEAVGGGRRGRTWNSNFSNNGLNFRYASNLFIWLSTLCQQLSKYADRLKEEGRVWITLQKSKLFQADHGLLSEHMTEWKGWYPNVLIVVFDVYCLQCLFIQCWMKVSVFSSVYNCCGERLHLNFIDRETQRLITNREPVDKN